MMHLGDRRDLLDAGFGAERIVQTFPGFGGFIDGDGTVEWLDLGASQPTTIDGQAPRAGEVEALLERTRLRIARTPDMAAWMNVHVLFVGVMAAGLVLAGGDPAALANDRHLLARTNDAIRDGLRALRAQGKTIRPRAIETLYLTMPRWFANSYWRRALPGPIGTVTMAPHVRASRQDELPILWAEAVRVTGGGLEHKVARFLAALI